MGVQRVMRHADAIGIMQEFIDLIKPEAIEESNKVLREQSALTDAELQKNEEARIFIAQYEALSTDLKQKQDELLDSQVAYQVDKENLDNLIKIHDDLFIQSSDAIKQKDSELTIRENILNNNIATLNSNLKQFDSDVANKQIELHSRETNLELEEKSLADRSTDIAAYEKALKDKADALKLMFN